MASNQSNDDSQSENAEEPIVAKLADDEVISSANSDSHSNPADTPTVQLTGLEGDDFGFTEDSLPSGTVVDQAIADDAAAGQSDHQSSADGIRVGSPFAIDPQSIAGTSIQIRRSRPEAFYDVGPLRYTAMGAVAAAAMVLGFAAAAAWWFPGGGTIIAALGCALSVFGLYSNRKKVASGCLFLHLLLFMISYSRAITV